MGMWGWKRKAHDGAKLVLVPVAVPKYAEHEVRALRDQAMRSASATTPGQPSLPKPTP